MSSLAADFAERSSVHSFFHARVAVRRAKYTRETDGFQLDVVWQGCDFPHWGKGYQKADT